MVDIVVIYWIYLFKSFNKRRKLCVKSKKEYAHRQQEVHRTNKKIIYIYIFGTQWIVNEWKTFRSMDFGFCVFFLFFNAHSHRKWTIFCCLMCMVLSDFIGFNQFAVIFHWIFCKQRFVSMWNLHTPTVYVLSIVSESMKHFGIFRWYVVVVENKIRVKKTNQHNWKLLVLFGLSSGSQNWLLMFDIEYKLVIFGFYWSTIFFSLLIYCGYIHKMWSAWAINVKSKFHSNFETVFFFFSETKFHSVQIQWSGVRKKYKWFIIAFNQTDCFISSISSSLPSLYHRRRRSSSIYIYIYICSLWIDTYDMRAKKERYIY